MAFVAGSLLFSTSNQASADIIYSFSANALAPEIGEPTSVTAAFEIDPTVADIEPSSGFGIFPGAIVSSSITFSDGTTSLVDFSGGTIEVDQDNDGGGGGFFLSTPDGFQTIILFDPDFIPFESDALIIDPQEVPIGVLLVLTEPDGSNFAAISTNGVLSVTPATVPEPSALGLLALGMIAASVRRRKKS